MDTILKGNSQKRNLHLWSVLYCCGSLIAVVILSNRFLSSHSPAQLFVFLLYCALVIFLFGSVIKELINSLDDPSSRVLEIKSIIFELLIATVISVFLEAATVYGSPGSSVFVLADWSKKRLIIFFFISFFIFSLYKKYRNGSTFDNDCSGQLARFDSGILSLVLSLLTVAASFTLYLFASKYAFVLFLLFVAILACGLFCFLENRHFFTAETVFLVISLGFGLFFAINSPITTGISWDDQIHFQRSLELSYLVSPKITETENQFINDANIRSLDLGDSESIPSIELWNSQNNMNIENQRNQSYSSDLAFNNCTASYSQPLYSLNSLGYIPSALGLWIGRLFHLNFSLIIILGRIFNLLAYSSAFYFAIKITPSKKMVFFVSGLIPTSLFMAANYSYDPVLISVLALGISLFLRAFWNPDQTIDRVALIASFAFVFIAIAVKAVYFPIVGVYFLAPRSSFASKHSLRIYYLFIILIGATLLASFALPYLFTVESEVGDTRGGAGINPSEQLRFIIHSPVAYIRILIDFFISIYLNPIFSNQYTLYLAYYGLLEIPGNSIFLASLPAVLLITCGLFGGNNISCKGFRLSQPLWTLFLLGSTLVLVATALYVSFTPVAHPTVNGCQFRYILPCLIPFLIFVVNIPVLQIGNNFKFKLGCIVVCILELLAVSLSLAVSCLV